MNYQKILYSFFPRVCPICEEIITDSAKAAHGQCIRCLSLVTSPTCEKCGRHIMTQEQRLCYDCTHNEKHFEKNYSVLNYDELSQRMVIDLKYHNCRGYAAFFGQLIAVRLGKEIRRIDPDYIIPVPVHKSRKRMRGYNQAELVALELGKILGIKVLPDGLIRTAHTRAMKELGHDERLKELQNAFSIGAQPPDENCVILLDDIYTTGSTIETCTKILWSEGIKVYSICVCSVPDY